MKFLVTNIDYDFNDGNSNLSDDYRISLDEMQQITEDTLGVWEADDEDDLIEEISTASGWCIRSIDYEGSRMKPVKTKYEQFQEWLDRCPVEIINYKDYSTEFEINFEVPLEKDEDERLVHLTSYDTPDDMW